MTDDHRCRDQAAWERIFAAIPADWYSAPPSDAMNQCRAYFAANSCQRLLDLGCGFGRWAQYLTGHGTKEVVGIDYAEHGIRAAVAWARREGFNGKFVVASVAELPFHGQRFDGVLAAVLLDNLTRADCARVVREVNAVARRGARGFFVFNPRLTPAELAAASDDNPTKDCTHVVYEDEELTGCLPGWTVTRVGPTAERFRVVEATYQPTSNLHGMPS
ncbi:MAG TPA: class I SAM-dependent methyltransferase [Gemmatimonadota bacterium]|nr:class I SAM-dependent methyltransferase [Gemmatimonadota bacterium]